MENGCWMAGIKCFIRETWSTLRMATHRSYRNAERVMNTPMSLLLLCRDWRGRAQQVAAFPSSLAEPAPHE
eukprot:3308944-Pleurochrysis_carterae.AAC.2